jgi:protein gp37
MNRTSIEWCNRPETRGPVGAMTWNPIRARLKGASHKARSGTFCTRLSPGCTHCYASTINKRFGNGLEFTVPNLEQIEFFVDERFLEQPLQQKKPCTIFVGDMFDLFHEAIGPLLIGRSRCSSSAAPPMCRSL